MKGFFATLFSLYGIIIFILGVVLSGTVMGFAGRAKSTVGG